MCAKSSISKTLGALAAVLLLAAGARALSQGDTPPPIDMPDRSGIKVDLRALRGKVVLVDFWASWCGPCRREMPVLESLHRKYADQGLVIVGINIDNNPKKMNKFLKSTPVSFRIVHDPKVEVAARYEPSTMPSSYFIGRDGKLRHVHEGFREGDKEALEARVKALLSEGRDGH
jgi:thiol-disulfide isomerase/thioredoxin